MLIRFIVNNLYSFGEMKEFNMLASPRYSRLAHHKYTIQDFNLLKLAAIYGANGAGKSNLIKALAIFQDIILQEKIPFSLSNSRFKLQDLEKNKIQTLAVEFFQEEEAFYYALEIEEGKIKTEELYLSGLGKKEDQLIYERFVEANGKSKIRFLEEFELDSEGKILKKIIENNLSKPDNPLLKLLITLDNPYFEKALKAYQWFKDSLTIIYPESASQALAHRLDIDTYFKAYAEDIICAYGVGINKLRVENKPIEDFFDDLNDIDQINKELEKGSSKMGSLRNHRGQEAFFLIKEGEKILAKQLFLKHKAKNDVNADFELHEESDGTIRLLDFTPVFWYLVLQHKVFLIDEIERSLHPLIIKELINKFSEDSHTKGQLIFTTHESQLLDQNIFRQDEIWFAEKNQAGSTDLYSLSDFKEHHTTDIRKGYLNGRYGSIPFLANLKDLNWHKYDHQEQAV